MILPEVKLDDLDDLPEYGKRFARERYSGSWGTDLNKGERDHDLVIKYDQWKKGVQAYLASISFVDTYVGELLDGLDKSKYADNTIIVFLSDNGAYPFIGGNNYMFF